ncbi:hypothetical protein [Candidatus Endomicrobiellum trichonymphae]
MYRIVEKRKIKADEFLNEKVFIAGGWLPRLFLQQAVRNKT